MLLEQQKQKIHDMMAYLGGLNLDGATTKNAVGLNASDTHSAFGHACNMAFIGSLKPTDITVYDLPYYTSCLRKYVGQVPNISNIPKTPAEDQAHTAAPTLYIGVAERKTSKGVLNIVTVRFKFVPEIKDAIKILAYDTGRNMFRFDGNNPKDVYWYTFSDIDTAIEQNSTGVANHLDCRQQRYCGPET